MKATVRIDFKAGVLDPQGQAVAQALNTLGFDEVTRARQGKVIELELSETDPKAAHERVVAMCQQLLANPVIEDYRIELDAPAA